MLRWCTYITIHEPTGKFYIGKGKTAKVKSGSYKGSGKILLDHFKKIPKELWVTEVLWDFDSEDDALSDEAGIVTEELLQDLLCLNCIPGGGIAHKWTQAERDAHRIIMTPINKIRNSSEEAKEQNRIGLLKHYQTEAGRKHAEETSKRLTLNPVKYWLGKEQPAEMRLKKSLNPNCHLKHSEEMKKIIAESKIGRKRYKDPTGKIQGFKQCRPGTEPHGWVLAAKQI